MIRNGATLCRQIGTRLPQVGGTTINRAASGMPQPSASLLDDNLALDDEKRNRIRNFSIIAHVDHGKSTLADRLMQTTGTVAGADMDGRQQLLDDMELERERGITIKMRSVRMQYEHNQEPHQLNLIDTPGHVDFSYEVSRSLAAVEGALLVVDASQGVQAQTIANVDLAIENDLEIFTVLNKIDLPHAEPERVLDEVEQIIGLDPSEAIMISAKQGIGIDKVLNAIVERIPPPTGGVTEPLRALIFDSFFDVYRGVIMFVRIKGGRLQKGDRIKVMSTKAEHTVEEVGIFQPGMVKADRGLSNGEVGYVVCGVKSLGDAPVGDTVTHAKSDKDLLPLPGYRTIKPMVYCGLFPSGGETFNAFRDAITKLKLNDASLEYEPENNSALGQGFRCGFLGLLHKEIVVERLEREYDIALLASNPSVTYRVTARNGEVTEVNNPSLVPNDVQGIEEPYVRVEVILPESKTGNMMEIFRSRRGELINNKHLGNDRIQMTFEMPLVEVISHLHGVVKSASNGYASMDYQVIGFRFGKLVRMDIAIAGDRVEALTYVVPRDRAVKMGKALCHKLKELIPRQQFKVAIHAMINGKAIAGANIEPFRKDVTAKCYGGDVTRKKKLLEKQKEGKLKMRSLGKVSIPGGVFQKIMQSS